MSLYITPEKIIAVYALEQWWPVKENSFHTDAYEYIEENAFGNDKNLIVGLGTEEEGFTGCRWTEEFTGSQISMNISQIKAWKTVGPDGAGRSTMETVNELAKGQLF